MVSDVVALCLAKSAVGKTVNLVIKDTHAPAPEIRIFMQKNPMFYLRKHSHATLDSIKWVYFVMTHAKRDLLP